MSPENPGMRCQLVRTIVIAILIIAILANRQRTIFADEFNTKLFAKDNLIAWCIVPFDSQKRSPSERAAMLQELGLRHFAYDYRSEHIATFEEEILQLQEHNIELTAWWFPTTLNDEAKHILSVLKKHNVQTQLWVMGGGDLTLKGEAEEKHFKAEVERIGAIARAAAEANCKVGLYNHGGWFGDPANQVKIIQHLKMPNVGIVYNLHHAHDQIDRLPVILGQIRPYLYAINLNGMKARGDQIGAKILPIGEGELDVEVVRAIGESGYRGPIGILNHTDEDAKLRLQDNIQGLAWIVSKINGKETSKPAWNSFKSSHN